MKRIVFSALFFVVVLFVGNAQAYTPFGGADTALISCLNTASTVEQRKDVCATRFIVKICSNNPQNFNVHSNAMCMLREYYAWKTALEVNLEKLPILEKNAILNTIQKNIKLECLKTIETVETDVKRLALYKCMRDITVAHTLENYSLTLNPPANSSLPNSGIARPKETNKK